MVTLKTSYRCEAAGRENNEDNGIILQLGDKGDLLVVCDGMGGMEAGEVASALAVATIEQWFAPEQLTDAALADPKQYLKQAIVGADANIKDYTKKDPKTEGMGSTIVMAWVLEQKVYVAWCGDSRAYRYNPKLGLERLSRDHSLVQSWVDAGQITEEQAFNHPQSNIITRSLGDPNGVAMPEAAEYTLYENDMLLLCSDGLCGTLRDREIEAVMEQSANLDQCRDQLWQADEKAGWHDNVTTAMAQVVAGGAVLTIAEPEDNGIEVLPEEPTTQRMASEPMYDIPNEPEERRSLIPAKYKMIVYSCSAVVLLLLILVPIYRNIMDERNDTPQIKVIKIDIPEERPAPVVEQGGDQKNTQGNTGQSSKEKVKSPTTGSAPANTPQEPQIKPLNIKKNGPAEETPTATTGTVTTPEQNAEKVEPDKDKNGKQEEKNTGSSEPKKDQPEETPKE